MDADFAHMRRLYYEKFFPFNLFSRWFHYGKDDEDYFKRREFVFTTDDEIYLRYQSFTSKENMRESILDTNPAKLDVGAVYSFAPTKKNKVARGAFIPLEKELFIDIDISDYDDIRTCCQGATVCPRCWELMAAACRTLDSILRLEFGFHHILWVFSGRRGIHCWICDEAARSLPTSARENVMSFLQATAGGGDGLPRTQFGHGEVHPTLQRVYEQILIPSFEKLVQTQDWFSSKEICGRLLDVIPDGEHRNAVRKEWESTHFSSSLSQWRSLKKWLTKDWNLGHVAREIVFAVVYPRMDVNVSKQLNHLLKSPFSIHPKTSKVCIPVSVEQLCALDPTKVITVKELLDEWDAIGSKEDEEGKIE
jgi:DNA primase small subunit